MKTTEITGEAPPVSASPTPIELVTPVENSVINPSPDDLPPVISEPPLPPSYSFSLPKLLPSMGQQTALERRMADRILALDPGLGETCRELAHSLADSGLSAASAALIIKAVYDSQGSETGRGQGVRAQWFVAAVRRRYGGRMERIRKNPSHFRTFLGDLEEVVEMRDILRGEGYQFSFEVAFLLSEIGCDADTVMAVAQELAGKVKHPSHVVRLITKAATMVQNGHFMEIETAIDFMQQGYETDTDDILEYIRRSDRGQTG